jgi:hypothetical protein
VGTGSNDWHDVPLLTKSPSLDAQWTRISSGIRTESVI